jgi:hypothetical protein
MTGKRAEGADLDLGKEWQFRGNFTFDPAGALAGQQTKAVIARAIAAPRYGVPVKF